MRARPDSGGVNAGELEPYNATIDGRVPRPTCIRPESLVITMSGTG